jgi:hypothetical protein
MATLPNEKSKPLSRLSIFRELSTDEKRRKEAWDLVPLILKLDQILEIDDVEYAADPPDFTFKIGGNSIGVELTQVNPALFGPGGYRMRLKFREWEEKIKTSSERQNVFTWGTFTLDESLASLKEQFRLKCDKVKRWASTFDERWLLLHLAKGSPFSELVGENHPSPGKEELIRDHVARVLFEASSILSTSNPFDYVIMFAGCDLIAFPCNGRNPYKLPMPRWDLVAKGARVDDSHLAWSSTIQHTLGLDSSDIITQTSDRSMLTVPKPDPS